MQKVAIRQPSGQLRRRPERLAADKAYDVKRIRLWLRRHGIQTVIPPKRRRGKVKPGRPVAYDKAAYRNRNVVERCVGWLKEARSLATRFDKLACNFLSMVHLAFIRRYLRILAPYS